MFFLPRLLTRHMFVPFLGEFQLQIYRTRSLSASITAPLIKISRQSLKVDHHTTKTFNVQGNDFMLVRKHKE